MPLRDTYKEGTYLRQWGLVRGYPDCLADGVPVDHPDADVIRARNARVRAAVAAVEAFDAAQQLVERVEAGELPAETVTVPVMVEEARANPAHAAYLAAVQLLAETPDEPAEIVEAAGLGEMPNPARSVWWAAKAAIAAGEPAETITVLVDGTEERPNPAWVAYQNALALVAGSDDTTRALALLRATVGPPAEFLDDGTDNPDRAAYNDAKAIMEAINAH